MRIVELRLNGHDGPPLELHPQITVVRDAESDATRQMVGVLQAVCRAQAPDVPTLIAVHGILFEATPRVLAALELGTDAAPVLTSFFDEPAAPALMPADAEAAADAAERVAAARIAHDQAMDALAAAEQQRSDAEAAAARVRAEIEAAETDPETGIEHDIHAARAEIEEAVARRAAAEAELGSGPEPDLAAANEWEERTQVARDAIAARVEKLRPGGSTIGEGRSELERREAALDDALAALPHGDVAPVRDALDAYTELGGLPPSDADADDGPEPPELVDARQALEEARHDLVEAERVARPPEFDPADVAALEEAHDEWEEVEERANRTMALPSTRRRLKQKREAEEAILDRMGLPSYGAYLMRTAMVSVDPASQYAVQQARATLKDARAHLDEVVDRLARSSARQELDAEARQHEAGAAITAAADGLRSALEKAGVPADPDDLVGSARAWLVAVAEAHDRRTELVVEREQVVAELAGIEGEGTSEEPGPQLHEAQQELHRATEELARARAAVEEARQEAARRQAVQSTIEEARVQEDEAQARLVARERAQEHGGGADVDALRRRLPDIRLEADSAQAAVVKARAQVDDAVAELRRAEEQAHGPAASGEFRGLAHNAAEQLEVFVLARLAIQRSVGRAGSLPLVLDGALDRVPVQDRGPTLDLLARMAAVVQVVVVSDDHDVAAWAEATGTERALVTTAAGT